MLASDRTSGFAVEGKRRFSNQDRGRRAAIKPRCARGNLSVRGKLDAVLCALLIFTACPSVLMAQGVDVSGALNNRTAPGVFADSATFLVVACILGVAAVVFFLYLHWRDWRLAQQLREVYGAEEIRVKTEQVQHFIPKRRPLIQNSNESKTSQCCSVQKPGAFAPGIKAKLTREPEALVQGWLVVQHDGAPAEIYVDGKLAAKTPGKLKLVEGRHTVKVTREGCASYKRQVMIVGSTEVVMRPLLKKSEPVSQEAEVLN